ncbi:murein biosynthesis integral membrane protein MurJ [Desulfolutivibrio sulfoxidireducens]|uniref:murein biosynthesis integral membrane protein MurJ n=1 Tax=Desulfolutivibrio sulfoxidireducens TaxID=2773299 RepID=UPI00159DB18B|nr:murein biosynthesis integral membrane protein MurJ [Desulfolutivibrio sulfoxidireducens]QLA16050.1 murein biosynthesis integral membrane protein MurJ [Desulfolutivibrio sulfoxidireducens]
MNEHARKIAKDVSIVGGATLASRILGFFRDVILAYVLGAGMYADAFYVAYRLPNTLRRLFAEGSMTMAFVPVFSRLRESDGDQAAFSMARSAMVWLLLILSVITMAAIFFAAPLTRLIAPGFVHKPELFALTVDLVRIVFPYIIQISAVALCMGVLNSMGHFLAPALATSELNTVVILGAGVAWIFGLDPAYTLAWAILVGGFGQWSMQQPWLRKYGFRWRGPWRFKDPAVIKMAVLMIPTAFGAAVYQINILLGTFLASYLPVGSVSYLYYADRLVQFPLGVFGVAIGTVALPSLAKLASSGRMEEYTSTLAASIRLTLFVSLPSTAGLIALAHPMVTVLFGRGAFSPEAAKATSAALVAYSLGLPAFACVRPLFSAYYALSDTKTPAWTAAACLLAYAATGYALMGPMGHVGLALAASVSSWLNVAILGIVLRKKTGPWMPLDKTLAVSTLLSLCIGLAAYALSGYPILSLACIAPLAVIYMAVAAFLGVEEARMLAGFVGRLVPRRFRKKPS